MSWNQFIHNSKWILTPPLWWGDRADPLVMGLHSGAVPALAGGRRALFLLHGTATTWDFMSPMLEWFACRLPDLHDHRALISFDWRRSIDELGEELGRLLARLPDHIEEIDLIGYSQGGLVIRRAVESTPAGARVGRVITLNTPHQGTPLANLVGRLAGIIPRILSSRFRFWWGQGIRDMATASPFLRRLARGRPPRGTRYLFVGLGRGKRVFKGMTGPFFLGRVHDGVVGLDSQLDLRPGDDRPIDRLHQLGDHFAMGRAWNRKVVEDPGTCLLEPVETWLTRTG